jgi:hypothetical protein
MVKRTTAQKGMAASIMSPRSFDNNKYAPRIGNNKRGPGRKSRARASDALGRRRGRAH